MSNTREIDLDDSAIAQAIIETEKEIAGGAWGDEETSALDETGDQSLEEMGGGLEGQHEDEDGETDDEGDEDGEDEAGEGEGDEESNEGEEQPQAAKPGETKPEASEPQGRVPAGRLREATERARAVEAERDQLRQQLEEERSGRTRDIGDLRSQLQTLSQLVTQNGRQQPATQQAAEQDQPQGPPDMFEDPKGFAEYFNGQIQSVATTIRNDMRRQAVETSFAMAHGKHGDTFSNALASIEKLDRNNPADRQTVASIYNSPNPGEALVGWHRRTETLARVGNDPAAYEERIRNETRASLLADPEFRKQIVAELRGEAQTANDGKPRTTTRLPRSLAQSGGSNIGADRTIARMEDSDQAVADSAWR